jgi:hypothetical protein
LVAASQIFLATRDLERERCKVNYRLSHPLALLLRNVNCMEWMCDHCRAFFAGIPYRVKSEESGVVLLDMIVCHYCYVEARKLGLRTEEAQHSHLA